MQTYAVQPKDNLRDNHHIRPSKQHHHMGPILLLQYCGIMALRNQHHKIRVLSSDNLKALTCDNPMLVLVCLQAQRSATSA